MIQIVFMLIKPLKDIWMGAFVLEEKATPFRTNLFYPKLQVITLHSKETNLPKPYQQNSLDGITKLLDDFPEGVKRIVKFPQLISKNRKSDI